MNEAPRRCGNCIHYLALFFQLHAEPPSYVPAKCGLCPLEGTPREAACPACAYFRPREPV